MTERLRIVRMGHRGDGVAETAEGPVYVPYTLPGELVEAEPVTGHPDRRHLLRVEEPSAERITAICPHFGVCGGCAVQHWAEPRYRDWKRGLVLDALSSERIEAPVDALIDAHGEGRRRAVFHARRGTHGVIQVGFAALRAHRIVDIDHCPVLAPGMRDAVPAAWAVAEALKLEQKPLDIQITATDGGLDVDVRGSGPLSPERMQALAQVAESHGLARLTRHGELVVQRASPSLRMDCATVVLPPGSFLQATALAEDTLARLVLEHASGAKRAADLFAGVGPFALRLAERMRLTAVDSDAKSTAALGAAAKTPGLKPIETLVRDLFRRPLVAAELKAFDAVVFDPPRQGAQAQAHELAASAVPRVIAVSCNAATFARDARILIDGGYRLQRVTPIDQFRYSAHVELVGKFVR